MDVLLAALLIVVLLAFFGWAVWISYLVVFRGWRIVGPPPAPPSNPNPKKQDPPGRPRRSGRR